jgi:hypothetical protein
MLGLLLHAPRGPFYSPKADRSRWRSTWKANLAFCRVVHRTVRCTTGHEQYMSGARFPSISGAADRWSSGPVGAPDSPVIFSRSAFFFSREQPVRLWASLGTGHCPVCHMLVLFWLNLAISSSNLFLFSWLCL